MASEPASWLAVSSRSGLNEFRHSGRQFVHVVHDQRSSASLQTNPVLGPAMASTGEADCGHAGGEGGIDTRRAVLDDETAVRRRHKLLRAYRNRSGAGLPRATIVALNRCSPKRPRRPVISSFQRICSRLLLDATRMGSVS